MRLPYELRLFLHIQHAVRVPVVARARDQVLWPQIRALSPRRRREVGVVAQIVPDVLVAVDEREAVGRQVEPAEAVVRVDVGGPRDRVRGPRREGPGAPLLLVRGVDYAGEEGWAGLGRCDVGALVVERRR